MPKKRYVVIKKCLVCKEEKPHEAKGLCAKCYSKSRPRKNTYGLKLYICIVCGKNKPRQAFEMCPACYVKGRKQKKERKFGPFRCNQCKNALANSRVDKEICRDCRSKNVRLSRDPLKARESRQRTAKRIKEGLLIPKMCICSTCGLEKRHKVGGQCDSCYRKRLRAENPEKYLELGRKKYKKWAAQKKQQDPTYFTNRAKNWAKANKLYIRLNNLNYRSKKRSVSDGTVTIELLESLYNQEYCYYCNEFTPDTYRNRQVEHKIPLSRGGPHSASNIVMSCAACNFEKHRKTDQEFKEAA